MRKQTKRASAKKKAATPAKKKQRASREPAPKLKYNYKSDLFLGRQARRKSLLIQALKKSYGVVTVACDLVGISRHTYYKWYHNDDDFKKRADEAGEYGLDAAETQLHKNIKGGKEASLIFYLKCRGRSRGFIERGDDSSLVVNITAGSEHSPEELM